MPYTSITDVPDHVRKNAAKPVNLTCSVCGRDFLRRASDCPRSSAYYRKFCGKDCYRTSRTGLTNPCYRGGLKRSVCEICGNEFRHPRKDVRRRTCSMRCRNELISRLQKASSFFIGLSGEKHPNWKGGISFEPYAPVFKAIRADVKERDGGRCVLCKGMSKTVVHHIDYNKENADLTNLITLCRSCHGRTNYHRNFWTEELRRYAVQLG